VGLFLQPWSPHGAKNLEIVLLSIPEAQQYGNNNNNNNPFPYYNTQQLTITSLNQQQDSNRTQRTQLPDNTKF